MKKSLLLLLSILFALSAYSTKRMISSTSIRISDGLSGDMISAIVQDSIGYLWIRTTEGVDRFDGTNFRSFTTQSDFRGLTFTPMNQLGVDGLGNVWIISRTGIDLFDYQVDSIVDLNPNRHLANFNEAIMAFTFTPGKVWFADKRAQLWFADISTRIFKPYPIQSSLKKITAIHEDKKGNLWTAGEGRIDRYLLRDGKLKKSYFMEGTIRGFYADSDGDLWAYTDEHLYYYKTVEDKLLKIAFQNTCVRNMNRITEAGKQIFYLGTSDFLFSFRKESIAPDGRINNYQRVDESDTGEFYSSIQTLLADKKGNLWIGTSGKGVIKLNNRKKPFQKLDRNDLLKYKISDDKMFSICFDRDNNLWLGSDGGGINRINIQTHEVKVYNTKNTNAILGDNITASCCDEQGFLWFGNRNAEISRLDPRSGKTVNYKIENEEFVRNISRGDNGKMWFAAANGLYCFNPLENVIRPYNPEKKPMKYTVYKAEQTNDSILWFATYKNGLFRCNLKDNSYKNYLSRLGYYGFNDFLIQGDTIYICTSKNGVLVYSIAQQKVAYVINDALDMKSNHANAILADEKGDLWISTNVGISRFSMQEQKVRNFYTRSGVIAGQFIPRS
ncbi:MAG: two-component regulator propeller domain-containing protein, partial [Bacteroides sp.]